MRNVSPDPRVGAPDLQLAVWFGRVRKCGLARARMSLSRPCPGSASQAWLKMCALSFMVLLPHLPPRWTHLSGTISQNKPSLVAYGHSVLPQQQIPVRLKGSPCLGPPWCCVTSGCLKPSALIKGPPYAEKGCLPRRFNGDRKILCLSNVWRCLEGC